MITTTKFRSPASPMIYSTSKFRCWFQSNPHDWLRPHGRNYRDWPNQKRVLCLSAQPGALTPLIPWAVARNRNSVGNPRSSRGEPSSLAQTIYARIIPTFPPPGSSGRQTHARPDRYSNFHWKRESWEKAGIPQGSLDFRKLQHKISINCKKNQREMLAQGLCTPDVPTGQFHGLPSIHQVSLAVCSQGPPVRLLGSLIPMVQNQGLN